MSGHHELTDRHDCLEPQIPNPKQEPNDGLLPFEGAGNLISVHELPHDIVSEEFQKSVAISGCDSLVATFNHADSFHCAYPVLGLQGSPATFGLPS